MLISRAPSQTTVSPQSPSFFIRLSCELRTQIYQHLYTFSVLKVATDTPSLPLTCKQIYAECTDLIHASIAFYVEDYETLLRWLKQLSPHGADLIAEI